MEERGGGEVERRRRHSQSQSGPSPGPLPERELPKEKRLSSSCLTDGQDSGTGVPPSTPCLLPARKCVRRGEAKEGEKTLLFPIKISKTFLHSGGVNNFTGRWLEEKSREREIAIRESSINIDPTSFPFLLLPQQQPLIKQ